MPDGVGVICFEFFAHGKDHNTAEQTNQTLNNYENRAGHPVFPESPWHIINQIEEIGFA